MTTIICAHAARDSIVAIVNHQFLQFIDLFLIRMAITTFIHNKTRDRFNFTKNTITLERQKMYVPIAIKEEIVYN
jgi:hypothetical protein